MPLSAEPSRYDLYVGNRNRMYDDIDAKQIEEFEIPQDILLRLLGLYVGFGFFWLAKSLDWPVSTGITGGITLFFLLSLYGQHVSTRCRITIKFKGGGIESFKIRSSEHEAVLSIIRKFKN